MVNFPSRYEPQSPWTRPVSLGSQLRQCGRKILLHGREFRLHGREFRLHGREFLLHGRTEVCVDAWDPRRC
jgi:hypothetical protein